MLFGARYVTICVNPKNLRHLRSINPPASIKTCVIL